MHKCSNVYSGLLFGFFSGFFFFLIKNLGGEKNIGNRSSKEISCCFLCTFLFFLNILSLTRTIFLLICFVDFFSILLLHQMNLGCWALTLTGSSEYLRQLSEGEIWLLHLVDSAVNTHCCLTSLCCQGDCCHQFTDVTLLRQVRGADWFLCKDLVLD